MGVLRRGEAGLDSGVRAWESHLQCAKEGVQKGDPGWVLHTACHRDLKGCSGRGSLSA